MMRFKLLLLIVHANTAYISDACNIFVFPYLFTDALLWSFLWPNFVRRSRRCRDSRAGRSRVETHSPRKPKPHKVDVEDEDIVNPFTRGLFAENVYFFANILEFGNRRSVTQE